MIGDYNKYIIGYIIIGIIHFLICYGITYRVITKYNKTSPSWKKLKIKWSELIFIKGIFWPIGFVMDIVKIISTIGV